MSKEYIKCDTTIMEALQKCEEMANIYGVKPTLNDFKNAILELPTADVEPVRHGEWREEFRSQKSPDGYFYWNTPQKKIYVCSICGREEIKKEPYCNCGAKMDGGSK